MSVPCKCEIQPFKENYAHMIHGPMACDQEVVECYDMSGMWCVVAPRMNIMKMCV